MLHTNIEVLYPNLLTTYVDNGVKSAHDRYTTNIASCPRFLKPIYSYKREATFCNEEYDVKSSKKHIAK